MRTTAVAGQHLGRRSELLVGSTNSFVNMRRPSGDAQCLVAGINNLTLPREYPCDVDVSCKLIDVYQSQLLAFLPERGGKK